jgi:hypothetical protein
LRPYSASESARAAGWFLSARFGRDATFRRRHEDWAICISQYFNACLARAAQAESLSSAR